MLSKNHAIRRADLGRRVLTTLYPRSKTNKNSSIWRWSWILGKLWRRNDLDAQFEELNPDALLFPWHMLKSPNGDLLIFNYRQMRQLLHLSSKFMYLQMFRSIASSPCFNFYLKCKDTIHILHDDFALMNIKYQLEIFTIFVCVL